MDKKFIIVQDAATANTLVASGFQLISQINGTYTFMNMAPQHFNFSEIDVKKLAYTNILAI
jgi:hypothetical protein